MGITPGSHFNAGSSPKKNESQNLDVQLNSYFCTQEHDVKYFCNDSMRQAVTLPWPWATLLWDAFMVLDEFMLVHVSKGCEIFLMFDGGFSSRRMGFSNLCSSQQEEEEKPT